MHIILKAEYKTTTHALNPAEGNRPYNKDEHYKITPESMGVFRPTTDLPRNIIVFP